MRGKFVEALECRSLRSGANAVLAEFRQIIEADRMRIHFDKLQLHVVASADLRAEQASTAADHGRITADLARLISDELSAPGNVSADLTRLESDEGTLRADIFTARQMATSDRNKLLAQLQKDRATLFADVTPHFAAIL